MCWDMQAILRHVSWIWRTPRQLRSASCGYVERSASFAPQSVAKSTGRLRFTAASVAVFQCMFESNFPVDKNEPLGRGKGQRTDEHRIHDREHGGRCPNGDCERTHDRQCEAPLAHVLAERDAEIVHGDLKIPLLS